MADEEQHLTINVIGATGQLGRKVIHALQENGAKPENLIASLCSPVKGNK
ncbi:MAG: hypothetical protein J4G05_08555 [Chlorobi bacterium]|nr:hypothetical protein [Chlorobiota bacterium]